ncbi:MAG: hypothetical protein JST80_10625 [Bdellovibrionales bacterium]|nr:hypothetical protein [Bdellovibrionales bacterium]
MKTQLLAIIALVSLSACRYDNSFTGQYTIGMKPDNATLDAYSSNVRRYCIRFDLSVNGEDRLTNSISAGDVIDQNNLLAAKDFNTKGANCNADETTYMTGHRSTDVVSTGVNTTFERCSSTFCRRVDTKTYDYTENLKLNFVNAADDKIKGTFEGRGQVKTWVSGEVLRRTGCFNVCPNGFY